MVYGTPTMFADMLGHQDLHKYDLSSLESGEIFKDLNVINMYFILCWSI